MIKLLSTWGTVSLRFKNSKLGNLFKKLVGCKWKLKTNNEYILPFNSPYMVWYAKQKFEFLQSWHEAENITSNSMLSNNLFIYRSFQMFF